MNLINRRFWKISPEVQNKIVRNIHPENSKKNIKHIYYIKKNPQIMSKGNLKNGNLERVVKRNVTSTVSPSDSHLIIDWTTATRVHCHGHYW